MSGWRRILFNRFVLVPGAIVLAIVLWNVYVATHNHGLITGRVVDAAGQPVRDTNCLSRSLCAWHKSHEFGTAILVPPAQPCPQADGMLVMDLPGSDDDAWP